LSVSLKALDYILAYQPLKQYPVKQSHIMGILRSIQNPYDRFT
jgi:hypothetical protein